MKNATKEQQGNFENVFSRKEYLYTLFQPKSALPFRTWLRCAEDGSSLQERALTCLLRFTEDHAPKLADCLQAPQLWHPAQSLQIINNALTQLNLIGNQEQVCVEDLFAKPLTAMGKRSLTARLCSPLADAKEIVRRQEEIQWIYEHPSEQKGIELGLASIYDLSRLHRSIVRGTLNATDVLQLYQSYQAILLLWSSLKGSPFEYPKEIYEYAFLCKDEALNLFDIKKAQKAQEQDRQNELGFLLDSIGPKSAKAEEAIQAIYSEANQWLKT
jgi:DNA mismatch repair ATPase MutS